MNRRLYLFLLLCMLVLPACRLVTPGTTAATRQPQIGPGLLAETPGAAIPGAAASSVPARLLPTTTAAATSTAWPDVPPPPSGTLAPEPTLPSGAAAPPTLSNASLPGPAEAPDIADYAISVRLDPAARALAGRETLTFHNITGKPVPYLLFHLYLNAFRSPDTMFMLESGSQLRGDAFDPNYPGWIEVDQIALTGGKALALQPLFDGTLASAALPQPVPPGGEISLEISFRARLPKVFARTGWALDAAGQPFFLVGQWFPKLAVWTERGWSAYPFHANAEFFSDFGEYRVAITLPAGYVTGATGVQLSAGKNPDGSQTVTYGVKGVIDFAWVASPSLKIATATMKGMNGKINYFYLPEHAWSKQRVLDEAVRAVMHFSDWYGSYPYPLLSVVDVPEEGSGAGGMEYPTFVTAGTRGSQDQGAPSGWTDYLEIVVVHEIAHQWFQSMLASNEGLEPWLDEGFADYSTVRYLIDEYGLDEAAMRQGEFEPGLLRSRQRSFLRSPSQPLMTHAWDVFWDIYEAAAYAKPDMALLTLQRVLGEETFDNIMHEYTSRYRFHHPTTADFAAVAREVSGKPLDWFFEGLVYSPMLVDYRVVSIEGSRFTAEGTGIGLPVEIQVAFTDGSRQQITWDGVEVEHTFNLEKTIQSVTIDPGFKILVDLNWENNSLEANR